MKADTVDKILLLNKQFYSRFASPFADSRSNPQPGFDLLSSYVPAELANVLDVGCGNGRFGVFLQKICSPFHYTGIDFSAEMLLIARQGLKGDFFIRDISQPGYLRGLGRFDLIVCLAVMQHVPGQTNRVNMLREMRTHLADHGRIFLANWQFLSSPRQRRKIRNWEEVGISKHEVEPGDYIMSWQRSGTGVRYVCAINAAEVAEMARSTNLMVVTQFRSDGREENLNLYTVLAHDQDDSSNE